MSQIKISRMFRVPLRGAIIAALAMLGSRGLAVAQSAIPKPPSTVGGYTGTSLQNLYRTDIGTGYSAQSLNNIALENARARVPNVGQQTLSAPAATIGPGVIDRATKPFTNISSRPTVSPYLNLFNTSRTGNTDFNYQTLVRPQLQQQALNQQLQRQNLDTDRKVQALAARGAYSSPAGSESQYPTGHQTTFMYTDHFYANANPHRKRTQ
jgi:hypothetical protein